MILKKYWEKYKTKRFMKRNLFQYYIDAGMKHGSFFAFVGWYEDQMGENGESKKVIRTQHLTHHVGYGKCFEIAIRVAEFYLREIEEYSNKGVMTFKTPKGDITLMKCDITVGEK